MGIAPHQPIVALFVGVPSAAAGAVLLAEWRQHARMGWPSRGRVFLVAGVAMLVLTAFAFSAEAYLVYKEGYDSEVLEFSYRAVLEPNGTGRVRVSLPLPTPEDLVAGRVVRPSSSSTAIGRGGPEPTLDVVFSERTTVDASFEGYRPGTRMNLTYTADFYECFPGDCESDVNVTVLEGSVSDVRIQLTVSWSYPCAWESYEMNVIAAHGQHAYPTEVSERVC